MYMKKKNILFFIHKPDSDNCTILIHGELTSSGAKSIVYTIGNRNLEADI